MVSAVLPTAVGPVITINVLFDNVLCTIYRIKCTICNALCTIYRITPRLEFSINEQMYSTSFESGNCSRAIATPSFSTP